jgi:GNAT superfamily N-acetyltransferase
MEDPMTFAIRPADPADLALIAALIRDLAEYEKLAGEVRFEEAVLGEKLFGPRPYAEVLIGEIDGAPQGFALFFHNFSTFEGRPGIYLEDLFVRPQARGSGLGKALLARLAALAVERDCARLEWSVLDWNEPAIGFYKRLGARAMDEWTGMRMDGAALAQLAAAAQASTDSRWNPVKHGVIHKRL